MSMLTPPGMGGKYKITGSAYPRMRRPRRRRRFLTAVALLLSVGVLGWGSLELVDIFTGGDKADAAQKPECETADTAGSPGSPVAPRGSASPATTRKAEQAGTGSSAKPTTPTGSAKPVLHGLPGLPEAGSITVNVYNATPRTGLAAKVSDELKKRGFKIGKVDNAPARYDKKVKETAVLVAGPQADKALTVLGAHLPGTRSVQDKRKDTSVDLMIGKAYKNLDTPQAARKALTKLVKPSPEAKAGRGGC